MNKTVVYAMQLGIAWFAPKMIKGTMQMLISIVNRRQMPGYQVMRFWILGILFSSTVISQSLEPIHPVDGNYILEWLTLDKYLPQETGTHLLQQFTQNSSFYPQAGDIYTAPNQQKYAWRKLVSQSQMVVYYDPSIKDHLDKCSFLLVYLYHPKGGDIELEIKTFTDFPVFLNGQRLTNSHHFQKDFQIRHERYNYQGQLNAGTNALLVHLSNLTADHKMAVRMLPPERAVVDGYISDTSGKPNTERLSVTLNSGGEEIFRYAIIQGNYYRCSVYPVRPTVAEIAVTQPESGMGARHGPLSLNPGARLKQDLVVSNVVSIAGRVIMLDADASLQSAVVVEALKDGKVEASALSSSKGAYQFVNLLPGKYQIRCVSFQGMNYYAKGAFEVASGQPVNDANVYMVQIKKGAWKQYNKFDGLAHNNVVCIHNGLNNTLLFGTEGGVSEFDGEKFVTIGESDEKYVNSVAAAKNGAIWYGTLDGLYCYHHGKTTTCDLTETNSPVIVYNVIALKNGEVWAAREDGLVRWDGKILRKYDQKDGMMSYRVTEMLEDAKGFLWLGTSTGLIRWDGTQFSNFPSKDQSLEIDIQAICLGNDGSIYVAVTGAIMRFDGQDYETVISKKQMLDPNISSI